MNRKQIDLLKIKSNQTLCRNKNYVRIHQLCCYARILNCNSKSTKEEIIEYLFINVWDITGRYPKHVAELDTKKPLTSMTTKKLSNF